METIINLDRSEYVRLGREQCTQKVFGGCAGASCSRDCFSARLADINARQQAQRARSGRWINVGIVFVLLIFLGAITPQAVENIKTWEVANVPQ